MSLSFFSKVVLSSLSLLAVAQASPLVTARAAPTSAAPRGTNTACAIASKASASYVSANPKSTNAAIIDYESAFNCIQSIPFKKNFALDLVRGLRSYLAFQSDKVYLKSPPSGYLQNPVDLDAYLDGIEQRVNSSTYQNEVHFQSDLTYMLSAAHDGHLGFQSDVFSVFEFELSEFEGLTSVSLDGASLPQVYFSSDLVTIGSTSITPVKGYTPSPVTLINGVDVVDYLLLDSWYISSQDPDAAYNSLFFNLGSYASSDVGLYAYNERLVPYNASVAFTFANGTTKDVAYTATVVGSLDGVVDEETAYETFCYFANWEETPATTSTTSAAQITRRQAQTSASASASSARPKATATSPTIPFFPYPVQKDTENTIAGYYLNDTSYTDVAVLQINSFEGANPSDKWEDSFVNTITDFLASATWNKKKYLIIDLQGNGGGIIDLGTAAAARIFPHIAPNTKSNMLVQDMMELEIYVASGSVAEDKTAASLADDAKALTPYDYEYNLTPDLKPFTSTSSFINGVKVNSSSYTSFFQTNYTDPAASTVEGFTIYSDKIANTATPFPASNIIVLTDGYCASTCTVFMEHLKNQGNVRSIAIGGRPQTGPMQAVGGIKGSQIFDNSVFTEMVNIFELPGNDEFVPKNLYTRINSSSLWASFDDYPLLRTAGASRTQSVVGASGIGVNGRNAFRIGDTSNTPLQYVYEAADCRMWYDAQMLYDPVHLWKRVADIAFHNYTGSGAFTSQYCVEGSTGHPTSITGGWKQGTLGPQTPPKTAYSQVNSNDALGALGVSVPGIGNANQVLQSALKDLYKICEADMGDKWLMTLICGWATS